MREHEKMWHRSEGIFGTSKHYYTNESPHEDSCGIVKHRPTGPA
jgi:hypothetical protein